MPIVIANFGVASFVSVPATILGSLLLGPILGLGVVAGFIESWMPGFITEWSSDLIVVPLGLFSRFVTEVGAMLPPISTTTSARGLLLSVPMAVTVAVLEREKVDEEERQELANFHRRWAATRDHGGPWLVCEQKD